MVPNTELAPEYACNADLTIGKTFHKEFQCEITGFYTYLIDAIVMNPTTFNGKDSILYDGYMCQIQTNTNSGNASVYGLQGNMLIQANPYFSIGNNLTWTYGRIKKENMPMDHIPPAFGQTSFILDIKKFKGEFYVRYNAWKKLKDYSPSGEDNLQYATSQGMPSWVTFNLRTSYQINKCICIQAGLENIMDEHYRVFASGISAPGRNLILAIRGNF